MRAELDRQGWSAGEEPIWRGLKGAIPRARVRRVLRGLKAERATQRAERLHAARTTTTVLARDTLWSLDATHLGRDHARVAVQAEVLREVASTRTIGLSVGPAATGEDVVRLLDRALHERHGAPLALLTDNGPAYRSDAVAQWCAQHHVLHLFSLPYTPQHNAACEHGMREIKDESALDTRARVHDADDARARLQEAIQRLDHHRLRATRGWRTAVEDDRQRPPWSRCTTRQDVWRRATCAIQQALLNSNPGRAQRQAIREAILGTLEHFSVIQRNRNGPPLSAQTADRFSCGAQTRATSHSLRSTSTTGLGFASVCMRTRTPTATWTRMISGSTACTTLTGEASERSGRTTPTQRSISSIIERGWMGAGSVHTWGSSLIATETQIHRGRARRMEFVKSATTTATTGG